MKVKDIMVKNVECVQRDSLVKDIALLICTNYFSAVPVVDSDERIVGIVSEKDVIKAMYPSYTELHYDPVRSRDFEETEFRYAELMTQKVEDLMTRKVFTVPPDTPILKAASIMIVKKIRRLPVVDDGKIIGIVSQGDIHQAIFRTICLKKK